MTDPLTVAPAPEPGDAAARRLPSLVSAAEVHAVAGEGWLRVLDATEVLHRQQADGPYEVRSGRPGYLAAHVPGAGFADVAGALSDPASPFPFTLPDPAALAAALGALGVGPGTHVVAYSQASPMWATRLWWLLRYLGFDDVSVLDGGLPAWRAAGLPVATGEESYPPAVFPAGPPRSHLLATTQQIAGSLDDTQQGPRLVNALPSAAFRGDGPGAYSRPGRIPGSVSLPAAHLIDPQTWQLRPAAERATRLGPLLVDTDADVVVYCGAGISATVLTFALAEAGRDDVRLYDGSLTAWSADPTLPLVCGDDVPQ